MTLVGVAYRVVFLQTLVTVQSAVTANIKGCTYRYDVHKAHHEWFNMTSSCENLRQDHSACKEEITVAFSNFPPYTQGTNSSVVSGLVADLLQLALDICCFDCTKIKYSGPYTDLGKLIQNDTIMLPIQSATTSEYYIDYFFIPFVDVHNMVFLAKNDPDDGKTLAKLLVISIWNTWPLFLIAFLLATLAGSVVWVLDMFFNQNDFPTAFPKGPFEGFWWAFVSMTTVGYGDHAPKSLVAKLFAIAWIMLGITIFTIYTASLTSSLSSSIEDIKDRTAEGMKVGLLHMSGISKSVVALEYAQAVPYNTTEQMFEALAANEIGALVLDEYLAKFYMPKYEKSIPTLHKLHSTAIEGASYGVAVKNDQKELADFLRGFFKANDDNKISMLNEVISLSWPDYQFIEEAPIDMTIFSAETPEFRNTIISLFFMWIFTIALGFGLKRLVKRHREKIPKFVSAKFQNKPRKQEIPNATLIPRDDVTINKLLEELEEMKVNVTNLLKNGNCNV